MSYRMNQDDPTAIAKHILRTVKYATLATVTSDGLPWNSPVRFVHDEELNVYWFSNKDSQHSRNVRHNGHVFIVIYDSTVTEGHGKGLYLQATAEELQDTSEVWAARMLIEEPLRRTAADFQGEAVRRAYKATVRKAWINGAQRSAAGLNLQDYRIEVPVASLKVQSSAPVNSL